MSDYKRALGKLSIWRSLLELFIAACEWVFALEMSFTVSQALDGNMHDVILHGSISLGVLLIEKVFSGFLWVLWTNKQIVVSQNIKIKWLKKALSQPLYKIQRMTAGAIKERITEDFDIFVEYYTVKLPVLLCNIVVLLGFSVYIGRRSVLTILILLILSTVQVITPLIVRHKLSRAYIDNEELEEEETDMYLECTECFMTIKLFGLEKEMISRMRNLQRECYNVGRKSIFYGSLESSLSTLTGYILKYIAYIILGILVQRGLVTVEDGVICVSLLADLLVYTENIIFFLLDKEMKKAAVLRVATWADCSTDEGECLIDGSICTNGVKLVYEGGKSFVSVPDIYVPNGKVCMLKGSNGSGKTTTLDIVAGFRVPDEGTIRNGNNEKWHLSADDYPNKVFYLRQKTLSFNVTAEELFAMYNLQIQEEAYSLAGKFGLTENSQYNINLSDLSGGERKKLYLSLAFACHPIILLLDEPTNDLDSEGIEFLELLLVKRRGTTIMVDHSGILDDNTHILYKMVQEK